jgi:AraC-like DNA-binding protein
MGQSSVFLIHKIEDFRHLIRFPLPPHRKQVYDLVLLTEGVMRRSKGLEEYEVGAGSAFFVPAHQITSNAFVSPDARGYYCHFEAAMLGSKGVGADNPGGFPFLQFAGHPVVRLPPDAVAELLVLLRRMEREYQSQSADSYELIAAYVYVLLLEIKRYADAGTPAPIGNAAQIITHKYKNALSEYIVNKHRIADYADLLAVSPNHLNKCVRQTTGRTASDWLEEMILLESKVLLSQTDLTVAQVASAVGMADQSYFGRFFRKKVGLTPTQYRKWIETSEGLPSPS